MRGGGHKASFILTQGAGGRKGFSHAEAGGGGDAQQGLRTF